RPALLSRARLHDPGARDVDRQEAEIGEAGGRAQNRRADAWRRRPHAADRPFRSAEAHPRQGSAGLPALETRLRPLAVVPLGLVERVAHLLALELFLG